MRALKPKPVEVVTEEPWFWGNNRGGGGAPLKDGAGVPLANLRDVIKGNVQADHSPSRSPIKSRRHYDDEDSEDRDVHDSRSRRRTQSPEAVRGLENHYGDDRRTRKSMANEAYNMDPEKSAKARRDLEYQIALKQQIADKQKQKDDEKRREDEVKQRDYEEFLASQGKGGQRRRAADIEEPQKQKSKGRVTYNDDNNDEKPKKSRRGGDDGSDDGYYGGGGNAPRRGGGGGRGGGGDSSYRDDNTGGRKGKVDRRADSYEDDDYDSNRRRDDHGGRNGHAGRGKQRDVSKGKGSKIQDDVVSRAEYDELADMYDELQRQHDDLREELRIQTELIEDLKLEAKARQNAADAAVAAARRGGPEKHRDGGAKKEKKMAAAFGGPVKPHAPLKIPPGGVEGLKQPSVDRRPNSMSTIERKRGLEGVGLKLPKLDVNKGNKAGKQVPQLKGVANNKPFSSEDSEIGGGLKSLLGRKGGGPVRVAYEADDGVENAGRMHSPVVRGRKSFGGELRGESEILAIRGEEVDVISEGQLDRLLLQARNAKGVNVPSAVNRDAGKLKQSRKR